MTDQTIKNKERRILELVILYGLLPCMLLVPMEEGIKALGILLGVAYVIYICVTEKLIQGRILFQWKKIPYWKPIALRFGALVILTMAFMYIVDPSNLFAIVRKRPILWITIVCFYSIFSVYPQEFLYRTFFFARYSSLVPKKNAFILLNGIVFCMAHLVFRNFLVLGLTFVGGIIFSITYKKANSLIFTSLEHALYGSWLFTIGMGEMLAFPLPE